MALAIWDEHNIAVCSCVVGIVPGIILDGSYARAANVCAAASGLGGFCLVLH